MTETTSFTEATTASSLSISPSDILLHLIVTLLAPMFLTASGGDIQFARMAALETVNAYRARNHADLIVIAQIIACGLTALGSLSLSMADNISLSMLLRLRGNAVALNRSAEQNRRALKESRPATAAPNHAETMDYAEHAAEPDEDFDEAEVIANVAAAQKRAADTQAHLQAAQRVPEPDPIPTPAPVEAPASAAPAAVAERQRQAMWAGAMADVAQEFTASLPHLPPAERKIATMRAAMLSSAASDLLSGNGPPRLRPSDLAAIMPPNTI